MRDQLPAGEVTFAFVDVVDSTRTLAEHGDAFVAALAELHDVVRSCTEMHEGVVVKTEGDGAFLAFPGADGAVRALIDLQARLEAQPEDRRPRLRLRAGAHTGTATPYAGDYVALAVNVAARVSAVGNAGQVLVSRSVVEALTDAELRSGLGEPVGEYMLKDVPGASPLWQACGDGAEPRAPRFRRTNVADPHTTFVGRAPELAELTGLVRDHRLVTVLGPGGLGKTRLVSQLALAQAPLRAGGVWLVELAPLTSAEQVLGAIVAALGLDGAGWDDVVNRLGQQRDLVLVLDNCEHLLDGTPDSGGDETTGLIDVVEMLLERCAALRLVCTSREALRLPDEVVYRLRPLTGREARIELFTSRAWAAGGRVDDERQDDVLALCERLDGLPLAIELAAAQAADVPITQLLDIVEGGHDALARRGGDARQRSLDAVLAWSLDRIAPDDREALLALSLLPGRFDDSVAAVLLGTEAGPRHLRVLRRRSLLDLDGSEYRLLDTVRAAARRRLDADPQLRDRLRQRHESAANEHADHVMTWVHDGGVELHHELLASAVTSAWSRGVVLGSAWMALAADVVIGFDPSVFAGVARSAAPSLLRDPARCTPDEALGAGAVLRLVGSRFFPLDVPPTRLIELGRRVEAEDVDPYWAVTASGAVVEALVTAGQVELAEEARERFAQLAATRSGHCVTPFDVHTVSGLVRDAAGDLEGWLEDTRLALDAARRGPLPELDLPVAEANFAEAALASGRVDQATDLILAALAHPMSTPFHLYCLALLGLCHVAAGRLDDAGAVLAQLDSELVVSQTTDNRPLQVRDALAERVAAASRPLGSSGTLET